MAEPFPWDHRGCELRVSLHGGFGGGAWEMVLEVGIGRCIFGRFSRPLAYGASGLGDGPMYGVGIFCWGF